MTQQADNPASAGPDTSIDAAVAALLAREAETGDAGEAPKDDVGANPPAPVADAPRKFRVKVDGQEQEVDEAELISGYSFRAHNTRTAQKLAEDAKAFEARDKEVTSKLERLNQILPELEKLAEADLARYAGVDWDALKRESPDQFASLRAEYDLDREKVEVVRNKKKETEAELAERREGEFREFAQRQYEALMEKRPEWKDETTRTKDMQRITEYALSSGYTPQEVASIYDHRAYIVLDKAQRYDALVAQVNAAKSKPNTTKPAAPAGRTVTTGNSEKEREAMARLQKTGRMSDAVAALLARG